jgi:hypothetical protein
LFGFNSFGLFFFYWGEIQLCKIKADVYSDADFTIPYASYTVFSSLKKDYRLVNKKEIIADGKLYDIVKVLVSEGETVYYTLHDSDEDEYAREFADWGKANSNENSFPDRTINLHIAKYFTIQKFLLKNLFRLKLGFVDHKNNNCSFFYKSPSINIFSPPPDLYFS